MFRSTKPDLSETEQEIQIEITDDYLRLDEEEVYLDLNESGYKILYTILPQNSIPKVTIKDETILSVTNFSITPLKIGTTTITLTHGDYTKTLTVYVINREITLSSKGQNFFSGKNNLGEYETYTVEFTANYKLESPQLTTSNNVTVLSHQVEENKFTLTFNLTSGTSFNLKLECKNTTCERIINCSQYANHEEVQTTYVLKFCKDSDETPIETDEIEICVEYPYILKLKYDLPTMNYATEIEIEDSENITVENSLKKQDKYMLIAVAKAGTIKIKFTSLDDELITRELTVKISGLVA